MHAGRPDRTQAAVREIMRRFHQGSEIGQGYGGDEDNGEMSAWHLFAVLGIYPTAVGSPVYALSSPLYGHARVQRDDGASWEVSAPGNTHDTVYVAGVEVDGVSWTRPWISHRELVGADELRFHLADTPQTWGSTEAPPSLTPETDGEVTPPRLLRDVASTAQLVGPDGLDHGSLTDDLSATDVDLPPGTMITIDTGDPVDVELITLTSARDGGAPSAWTLEAETESGWIGRRGLERDPLQLAASDARVRRHQRHRPRRPLSVHHCGRGSPRPARAPRPRPPRRVSTQMMADSVSVRRPRVATRQVCVVGKSDITVLSRVGPTPHARCQWGRPRGRGTPAPRPAPLEASPPPAGCTQ